MRLETPVPAAAADEETVAAADEAWEEVGGAAGASGSWAFIRSPCRPHRRCDTIMPESDAAMVVSKTCAGAAVADAEGVACDDADLLPTPAKRAASAGRGSCVIRQKKYI